MKKTVFLTGATGHMGFAGLQELVKRRDRFEIKVLSLDTRQDRKKLAPYQEMDCVQIIWGDLTNYADVLEGVTGADIVLHVGGMVSPAADYKPVTTRKVNVGAAENIAEAVLAQPNADAIKVVYIGSVAQTGDRNPPIHWARTGDPINISVYDHYAISKTIAERVIVESGIKHWVSLRQSGILYPDILKNLDPIMFHVPLKGVLEWTTVEDSGRLLANICEDDVPETFWNRFYNIGSGKEYRITNYEFEELLLGAVGLPSIKKLFEANWFALRNFHGQWYADSDKLDDYLHFRENKPIKDYFAEMAGNTSKLFTILRYIPKRIITPLARPILRRMANMKGVGTLHWIKHNDHHRVPAFFGKVDDWKQIKSWDDVDLGRPTTKIKNLDHGYDESKPLAELSLMDMRGAALFRGGECLSDTMEPGDLHTKLKWRCQFGDEFEMSPALALLGGHWCPNCLPEPWNYDEIAKGNPFFAQVWRPHHAKDEKNYYDESIFAGWEKKRKQKSKRPRADMKLKAQKRIKE